MNKQEEFLVNRKEAFKIVIYVTLLVSELAAVSFFSDLSPETQNWIPKARELIHLQIPNDNFYGPGAAFMMIPFAIFGDTTFLANYFYLALGAIAFWKISSFIPSQKLKLIALASLPANFYLIWLINSSQDTVFEFCLLTWALYFLTNRRFLWFTAVAFLLCETRAGYWVFFLGVSFIYFVREYMRTKKLTWSKLVPCLLLILSSFFNFVNYSSPSPALEGGVTAYFSYTKYHYLALPKMDMDVFLSGPNGAFSANNGPAIPQGSSPAEVNRIYQSAAIDSALSNKKETMLGWMQKFDSYIFDVQKVPHLPGAYVLNQDNKTISIVDERLSWQLILGNLAYEIYRTILLVSGLIALGLLLGSWMYQAGRIRKNARLLVLATPFVFGIVPGLLFYTETRFKIVSELLLVPLVAEIWSLALSARTKRSY